MNNFILKALYFSMDQSFGYEMFVGVQTDRIRSDTNQNCIHNYFNFLNII
jgi:hypothetical protein